MQLTRNQSENSITVQVHKKYIETYKNNAPP